MSSAINTSDKNEFVRWFLKSHQLKRREGVWILNYLIADPRFLKNVHFVQDAKHCPRGLIISSVDVEGSALAFYKKQQVITDGEKIFHDIRSNFDEPLYIELNFDEKTNPHYIAVLEENPYASNDAELSEADHEWIDTVLNESTVAFKRTHILNEIDAALDAKDETRFIELTQLLQTLK